MNTLQYFYDSLPTSSTISSASEAVYDSASPIIKRSASYAVVLVVGFVAASVFSDQTRNFMMRSFPSESTICEAICSISLLILTPASAFLAIKLVLLFANLSFSLPVTITLSLASSVVPLYRMWKN